MAVPALQRVSLCVAFVCLLGLSAPAAAQTRYVFVLGSSTAQGVGASARDSAWVYRYARYVGTLFPDVLVANLGVGGYTTYHIVPTGTPVPAGRPAPDRDRNITQALLYNPRAIIVNMPSNDATLGYTVEEQLHNFDRIVAAAAAQNVPVWISTTQPRTNNLNDAGRANLMAVRDSIRARYGAKALDFWTGLALPDGRLDPAYSSGDGIHLNDAGHRILYTRVRAARIVETFVGTDAPATRPPSIDMFPNPFRDRTDVRFTLEAPGPVRLSVFDLLGREVVTLVDAVLPAGSHTAALAAGALPPGRYLYRLRSAAGVTTAPLLRVR